MESFVARGLMNADDAYHYVAGIVSPDDFLVPRYRAIVRACAALTAHGHGTAPALVAWQIVQSGSVEQFRPLLWQEHPEGEPAALREWLAEEADTTPTSIGIETWAAEVARLAALRRLQSACTDAVSAAAVPEASPRAVAADTMQRLTVLSGATPLRDQPKSLAQIVEDDDPAFEAWLDDPGRIDGYQTHTLPSLDYALDGFQRGRLYVVAARTSVGKTLFAANVLTGLADAHEGQAGITCHYVSLEMTDTQIKRRMTWARAGIAPRTLRRQGYTTVDQRMQIRDAVDWVKTLPIMVDSLSGFAWESIKPRIEQGILRDGAQLVWLDHIDFVEYAPQRQQNRHSQLAAVMGSCKELAKKYDVPVIVMSQINRSGGERDGGVPTMADLRESGSKEEDADVVLILHRPAYQKADLAPDDPRLHEFEVHIPKQRDGEVTRFDLYVDVTTQRLCELSHVLSY